MDEKRVKRKLKDREGRTRTIPEGRGKGGKLVCGPQIAAEEESSGVR